VRRWLLCALIVLCLVVTPVLVAGKGDAKAGKAVYTKRCASCHGPNGEGNAGVAKMLKVQFRHLGSKEVQAKSDAELRKDIKEGTGKMKPVTGLSDKELDDVIACLRTLAKK